MYQDNIYVLARSWPDFSLDVSSGNDISCSRYCSTQYLVLPSDSDGKESSLQCRVQFLGWEDPLEKIPWKRIPTPVFFPGESQRQRSLVGYSPGGRKESDTTERFSLHFTSLESLYTKYKVLIWN